MTRNAIAILLGLAVTIGVVVCCFVGVAVLAGGLLGDPDGDTINLDPFLWTEIVGGTIGATLGGFVVMSITRRFRTAIVFALLVLVLGGLEAAALIASPEEIESKTVVVTPELAATPPIVGALGAVLGALACRRADTGAEA